MKNYLVILFVFFVVYAQAQKVSTLTYHQTDSSRLELDLFLPASNVTGAKLPLVLYVHGGGFSSGDRFGVNQLCQQLAGNGYAAATISYTLFMKNKSFGCDGILTEKVKAIQLAVNDLWQATAFFINNQQKYNLDINQFYLAGSSAGAEVVLHAAFWDFSLMNVYGTKLPPGFKYAGIVAGAGALMDINLITKNNLLPIMLFHGNADETVPYATAAHRLCKTSASGWLMFFGSYSIYNRIQQLNGTTHLYTFCGGAHEYSGEFFYKDVQPTISFFNQIREGKKFQHHSMITTGKKNADGYSFCD